MKLTLEQQNLRAKKMNEEQLELLSKVKSMCKEDPYFLNSIIQVATDGLVEKTNEANTRATEFETIALAACSNRFNNRLGFIKHKISKLKTSFDWDSIFQTNSVNEYEYKMYLKFKEKFEGQRK